MILVVSIHGTNCEVTNVRVADVHARWCKSTYVWSTFLFSINQDWLQITYMGWIFIFATENCALRTMSVWYVYLFYELQMTRMYHPHSCYSIVLRISMTWGLPLSNLKLERLILRKNDTNAAGNVNFVQRKQCHIRCVFLITVTPHESHGVTSLPTVCSTAWSCSQQIEKIKTVHYWPFVRGI